MNKEIVLDALASRDHQQALATISWLNNCQTRDDFNQTIKAALLPLMACSGAFYGLLAGERSALQLLGSVNQSTCCQHGWEQFLNAILQKLTVENSVSDNATEQLPISATSVVNCIDSFSGLHLSFDQTWQQSHHNCTIVTVFDDDHLPAYRFYFCRLNGQQQIFSPRDIELLKILRPALLQALRLILFREEKLNSRQVLSFWSDNTDPIIVIRDDGAIIFQSRTATNKIFPLMHHQPRLTEYCVDCQRPNRYSCLQMSSLTTVSRKKLRSLLMIIPTIIVHNIA